LDETYREQLQSKFRFEEWASPAGGEAGASIEGLATAAGDQLGGWTVARVDALAVPGARSARLSFWRGDGRRDDVLLRLDLVEAASPSAARELLLEMLGEFQSPQIARLADPPAGDVAFGVPDGTALLFARGEVVAMVRNAGRSVVAADEFARLVDERVARGTGGSPG